MICYGLNHWKPNGSRFFAGDCMPFYKDGVFHLYYLLDINHHNHPLVGNLGGHVYAHAVSTDLIHWEHKPTALPLDFDAGECSNCTGSILAYNGRVFIFNCQRSRNIYGEHFRIFVSDDDGVSFHPWEHTPRLEAPDDCRGQFRDPHAFVGEDGLIHILMSSGKNQEEENGTVVQMGCLHHYTTKDMIHYEKQEPLLEITFIPECADYFEWNGKYYYSINRYWQTEFHCSDAPFGPWMRPRQNVPASRFCAVMKTAPWKDGRRIGVGWIPSFVDGQHVFGGRIVFREMVQRKDGSLGTAFVDEMLPDRLLTECEDFTIENQDGEAVKHVMDCSNSFRMDGTIKIGEGTGMFSIKILDKDQIYSVSIKFDPVSHLVELTDHTRIKQVEMGEEIHFRLVRTDEIFDLEINGERTIVAASYNLSDSFIEFIVENGKINVSDLKFYN